ncbi:universal stress protein [Rhodovulum adriaticum]|uniref:Universal stress protein n=1 Tax=Rhodovulum adriaticum TaxID=35804 RepID=A0A4V2SL69_RHOAD|nr:universal stress protein [Rhodovulum adriaticum]MBK1635132.1 universal stress protein [Rhodovulum adriaticum]TCP22246.1 nucleotide-binding universal stress UspA family protein [Rhodovulum adriaticum]
MTRHILCAVDLQHAEADAKVLKRAAELAGFYGATLSVVTVIPDYGMSIVGSYFEEGTMKKAVRAANDQLHAFVARVLPDFGKVQHIVEVGSVYEMVLDAADRSHADLVVMGAHKPDIIDRFQGPNSARVARYAKISVLIVRE